jgi:hypothetical protein
MDVQTYPSVDDVLKLFLKVLLNQSTESERKAANLICDSISKVHFSANCALHLNANEVD